MPNSVREVTTPASSVPVLGDFSSGTHYSDMFTPNLGRAMYLTLTGVWVGVVQVQRSVDLGKNWNNVTDSGGRPWLNFISNCDEVIGSPTDAAGTYRLAFQLDSGDVFYRLAQ